MESEGSSDGAWGNGGECAGEFDEAGVVEESAAIDKRRVVA